MRGKERRGEIGQRLVQGEGYVEARKGAILAADPSPISILVHLDLCPRSSWCRCRTEKTQQDREFIYPEETTRTPLSNGAAAWAGWDVMLGWAVISRTDGKRP